MKIGNPVVLNCLSQLAPSAFKARNTLITLFAAFCLLDAVLVVMVQNWWAAGRILLIVALMYFVVQGRRWAKWLLVTSFSLLTLVLLTLLTVLGPKLAGSLDMEPRLATVFIAGIWILALLSFVIPAYLIADQDLNRYLAWKRKQRSPKS